MKNILIVEDESLVALEISGYLKELGYNVVATVTNADKALELVRDNSVDLILMDVHIKGEDDGITAAQNIRKEYDIPLIYISAFSDDETFQRAVLTYPVAYLIKPFNHKELEVAIRIAFSRKPPEKEIEKEPYRGDIVFDEDFSYDTKKQELIHDEESIHLTKQELKLLQLFIKSKNTLLSLYEIENELWPNKESNDNTRRALISRLRAKLNYKFIETIHSIGYKFHI